ncbi:ANK1, partial [Symbiodinium pilosum]
MKPQQAVRQRAGALAYASEELRGDKEFILQAAVRESGGALAYASWELRRDKEVVLEAVALYAGIPDLYKRPAFLSKEADVNFMAECRAEAGTGVVFTYYKDYNCFETSFRAPSTLDSEIYVPPSFAFLRAASLITFGTVVSQAYDKVMEMLRDPDAQGSTATVWFGDELVFGHAAADGWVHPSTDCGRDEVPVPPPESRDQKWQSSVDSRSASQVSGSEGCCPGWCCHWLREVRRHHDLGEVICCAISNIFFPAWVRDYGAGSSELSDKDAEKYGLTKENFRNGRPDGWGEGKIVIEGSEFDRAAPVHPRTQLPLGVGCRWERQALDGM